MVVNERLTTRLGFLLTGAFLLYIGVINWERGQIFDHPEVAVGILVTYVVGFGLLFLSIFDFHKTEKYRILIFLSLIFSLIFSVYVYTQVVTKVYGTDALAFSHYSAELALEGQNPYEHSMLPALEEYEVPLHFTTPMLDGLAADRTSYPALSFLIYVPFVWMGLADMRWVTLLFHVATLSLIYFKSPPVLRPLIILPLFIIPSFLEYTGGAVTDFLWVLPLVLMVIYMRRADLSGVLFGLACSIKQTPWLLVPFLLVWLWKSNESLGLKHRLIQIGKFCAISGATFLVFNLPFIIDNPNAWYLGVSAPISGDMIPFGSGLSILTQIGMVSLPKSFYTVSAGVVLLTLLVNYYLHFDRIKYAIWLFPAIILWFSYRSLQSYFIYWVPLLVVSFSMWYASLLAQEEEISSCEPIVKEI